MESRRGDIKRKPLKGDTNLRQLKGDMKRRHLNKTRYNDTLKGDIK